MERRTSAVAVGAFLTCSALLAAPAAASRYYSGAHPLTAYQDHVAQAQMHGRFYKEHLTYLRNNTNQRDPRPGGDKIFERTVYAYDRCYDGTGCSWDDSGRDQGPKTDSRNWYFQYDHDPIPGNAQRGKIRTQVCEDHGIWPDPCSAWPQQIFGL